MVRKFTYKRPKKNVLENTSRKTRENEFRVGKNILCEANETYCIPFNENLVQIKILMITLNIYHMMPQITIKIYIEERVNVLVRKYFVVLYLEYSYEIKLWNLIR